MRSSLFITFNVVLLAALSIAFGAASVLADYCLKQSAREQALDKARVLLGAASASSDYSVKHIAPLLGNRLEVEFLPQLSPSLATTEQMREMLKAYPDYRYRQAAVNPPNPSNKATGWEVEVIEQLREKPELVGEREQGNDSMLFVARPIQVSDPACLACHGSPDTAPQSMTHLYGPHNGFGWKPDEIVGVRFSSVPLAVPMQQARDRLYGVMLWLLGIFTVLFCTLSLTFHTLVTRRLKAMADIAERVSLGEPNLPSLTLGNPDDLARMGQSFTRMRTSLACALNLLEAQPGTDHA
ncbi:DUF3365 domain-containing protein [Pseudomonas sp. NPDC090233]|uniref:c-type heme family protein n=1 Tax=Pseudomonas sp. NPDC090233 TaxID=3364479 RepID=UPI00383AF88D